MVCFLFLIGCTPGSLINWGSGWTATAVSDGTVFVGTKQGEVLALDANLGGEDIWGFSPEDDDRLGGVFGMPAVGEELVYVGDKGDDDGEGGKLFALRKDRFSGSSIRPELGEWVKPLEGGIVGGPALGGGLVLVGSNDGNLYAFDSITGKMAWSYPTDGRVWSAPAVGDGVVYFGSMDRHIYALSLDVELDRASRLLWSYKTGGAVAGRPLLLDDMVIVGSFDRKLYALDAGTGALLWTYKGDDWFWAGPVSDGKFVFGSSMGGTVYALDKKGGLIWLRKFEEASPIVSTPVVVADKLVVATDVGRLHLLSAKSGEKQEVFKDLGSRVKADLSVEGNIVFVGVEDSTVRALNVDRWTQVWEVSIKQ